MDVTKIKFTELKKKIEKGEGLVFLGTGEPINEWVTGITKVLFDQNIATVDEPDKLWTAVYLLETTGGRHDLVFQFPVTTGLLDIRQLALWRLAAGNCSWWSDYIVNYKNQHEQTISKQKEKVKMQLVGIDGNAFSVMGEFKKNALRQGWTNEQVKEVIDECMKGDYNHMLVTIIDNVDESSEEDED